MGKQMRTAMRGVTTILAAAALLATASPGVAAAAGLRPIFKVDSAAATISGNRMTIIASGAVPTGGWGKARLRLKPGHKPETSQLEFEFLAVPPPANEAVIQALVPVTVTLTMHLPPYAVTQIRVDAQTNSAVAGISH
jgi:hypothetical protein